jgi:hypothetical protein
VFHHVSGSGFFACVFAWAHEAVYESFYDVYACFAEALVLVASHAVRQGHGCQVYVALQAGVFNGYVVESPFLEE